MRSSLIYLFCFIFSITNSVAAESCKCQGKVYTFGIVPQQSARDTARAWVPLLRYIEQQTGIRLHFETAPTIPEFEKRLAREDYDFAYMNPYHYTVFHEHPGYIAFAKQEAKKLTGILVVRDENPADTLSDLNGDDIAFPAPAAFAATLVTQATMKKQGIQYVPYYVRSHDSVYRNVAMGLTSAGGGIDRTLSALDPSVRGKLKILWRSEPYTPHAFAAHPSVPPEVTQKLLSVMQTLKNTKQGRQVLLPLKFKGIESANNNEWDPIRKLDIEVLQHLIEK